MAFTQAKLTQIDTWLRGKPDGLPLCPSCGCDDWQSQVKVTTVVVEDSEVELSVTGLSVPLMCYWCGYVVMLDILHIDLARLSE